MDNKDLDRDLMEKLDRKDLEKEMEMRENECAGCGEKHENFEDTNPYRHIEEANEENYQAELNK